MRLLVLLIILSPAAWGQLFVFGFKAGVPVTDAFSTASSPTKIYSSDTRRYTLGPSIELRLPLGLGAEANLLYKRLGYDLTTTTPTGELFETTTATAWELPLLAKLRLPMFVGDPFVAAGPVWRNLGSLKQLVTLRQARVPIELNERASKGAVIAGGLEFQLPFIRLQPELRITRWGSQSFRDPIGLLRTNKNQAELLLGVTF